MKQGCWVSINKALNYHQASFCVSEEPRCQRQLHYLTENQQQNLKNTIKGHNQLWIIKMPNWIYIK